MPEIKQAHDRVLMGPAKKSHKYTEHEKKVVAYHEAGHAVMGIKLDGANEVQKITIVPRGAAGGYNLMLPKEETYLSTKKELLETISGLLGGRVAEEFIFNEITTGAQREHRYEILKKQAEEKGLSKDVEFYLEFFKYGCPPHGGFGLGIDRLTMLLLGLPSLKESMFIFRGPNHLNP